MTLTIGTPPQTSTVNGTYSKDTTANKTRQAQANRSQGAVNVDSKYSLLRATSEGGDKRMLDIIFERLTVTIRSEWTEGQEVARILETFEDVVLDQPNRLTDEEKEDELMVEMWKEEIKQHVSEKRALGRAKQKLYSKIWSITSKVLRNKISGQDGFFEKNTAKDVVWLVKIIRVLVTDFDNSMPEILSVSDALEKIVSYRQTENMENADYVKNLMALIKVYEQYCGPYGVHYMEIKRIEEHVSTAVDGNGNLFDDEMKSILKGNMVREIRERTIAMQIIRGACKRRYSSLRKNLATDFGLKIDKYPDTIDGAVNALNVAESQLPTFIKKNKTPAYQLTQTSGEQKTVAGTNGKTVDHVICHKCKNIGHYANKCPMSQSEEEEEEGKNKKQP